MAPELKRVRNKPAEWWAAAPSESSPLPPPSTQRSLPLPKRREGKGSKEKTANNLEDEEDRGPETVVKTVRRGRPSAEEKELKEIGDGLNTNTKRKRSAVAKKVINEVEGDAEEGKEPKGTKRRGRRAIVQDDDEQTEGRYPLAEDAVAAKKKGRPASRHTEDGEVLAQRRGTEAVAGSPVTTTSSSTARRGRSSNTEAELRAVNYKEARTQKRSSLGLETVAPTATKEPKVSRTAKSRHGVDEPQAVKEKNAFKKPDSSNRSAEAPTKDMLPPRRGRSSNTEAELQAINYKEAATRKQGGARATNEPPPATTEKLSSSIDSERRRGRSSNTESELRDQVNYKESKTLKRRGVPGSTVDPHPSENTESRDTSGSVRKRQSFVADSTEVASSNFSKSRNKSAAKPATVAKSGSSASHLKTKPPEKPKKGKKGTDVATQKAISPEVKKSRKAQESQKTQKKRKSVVEDVGPEPPASKRRRSDRAQEDVAEEEDEPGKAPEYQHLTATTRKVSLATINAKWSGLPAPCFDRISGLLEDLQRPVVVRYSDEQKRKQASAVLQMISRRLVKKVSRGLPFPPSIRNIREDDFDFEKILDHNRSLEAQLTPALHANELLEAELAKEAALLEAEQSYLSKLEVNAKAEATKRKLEARNVHALLQSTGPIDAEELQGDLDFDISEALKAVTPINLAQDEHLQAVVTGLQGHVDSIEGNLKQVEGITDAIARSRAAVQTTLFGHLNSAQYENVVLG